MNNKLKTTLVSAAFALGIGGCATEPRNGEPIPDQLTVEHIKDTKCTVVTHTGSGRIDINCGP